MEGRHSLLLLALLAAAAAGGGGAQPGGSSCEPAILATQVSLFCAPDMPTAQCCEPVVASVDLGGGVPCLCRVAAEPQLIIAGLNATHLLTLYAACGGLRPGGSLLAAACESPAPPAAGVVTAAPPPAAPRRKQPLRDAPPPPGEKTAAPPQQHGDHGKEASFTLPATPPSAARPGNPPSPAQAIPPPPHSGASSDIARLNLMTIILAFLIILMSRRYQN